MNKRTQSRGSFRLLKIQKEVRSPLHTPKGSTCALNWAKTTTQKFSTLESIEPEKTLRETLSKRFFYVSPNLEKNVLRVKTYKSAQKKPSPLQKVQVPSRPFEKIHGNEYIDKYYRNSSKSNAPNQLPFPGDWNFSRKKIAERAQSILFLGEADEDPETKPRDYLEKFILEQRELLSTKTSFSPKKELTKETQTYCWKVMQAKGHHVEAREAATITEVNGVMCLFGGQSRNRTSEVRTIVPRIGKWKILNTQHQPRGRVGHSAVEFKGNIVVFGGWSEYSYRLRVRKCKQKIYTLNLNTRKWQRHIGSGNLPSPRRHHSAAKVGKSMVVFGGINKNCKTLGGLYILDLETYEWEKVAFKTKSPCKRSHATLTAVFDESDCDIRSISSSDKKHGVYLFGGLSKKPLNDLWVLKVQKGELVWEQLKLKGRLPLPRYHHTCNFLDSKLFIIGGRNDSYFERQQSFSENTVAVLDLEELEWSGFKLGGKTFQSRWGHVSFCYNSQIFVFGGINYFQYFNSDMYILETNQEYVQLNT